MRRAACLLLAVLGLGGCSTMAYYSQLLQGQLAVLAARRPIAQVLADPHTPPDVGDRLRLVERVLDFAETRLALPSHGSYREYADLDRPYVLWNVFATPEFSLEARQWCYPLAGCFAYRGYYNRAAAEAEARRLRQNGLDVYIGGVPAYSTLGWFDDPVLNTMLRWDETALVGSLFHELAHQRLFVKNDTEFNESFASFVETEGLRRWLAAQDRTDAEILLAQRRRDDFLALIEVTRAHLAARYAQGGEPGRMRADKAAIFEDLRARYRALRDGDWQGYSGYDAWFAQPLNNASLLPVGIYNAWTPAFSALFSRQSGDWTRFYEAASRIGKLDAAARAAALRTLAEQAR